METKLVSNLKTEKNDLALVTDLLTELNYMTNKKTYQSSTRTGTRGVGKMIYMPWRFDNLDNDPPR